MANSATISVAFLVDLTPALYTLHLVVPLDIDVDGDGSADIRVVLEVLNGGGARIKFINLNHGRKPNLLPLMGVG